MASSDGCKCAPGQCWHQPIDLYGDHKMTDFKVGDVVQFTDLRQDRRPVIVESVYLGAAEVPCIKGRYPDGSRCDGWYASRFELVSRAPSDPKPALKVGDRVRVKVDPNEYHGWNGTTGVIEYWHPSTQTWNIRHDGEKPWGQATSGWGAASLELLPPEPAKEQCIMGAYCPDGGPGKCFHPPAGFYDKTPPTKPAKRSPREPCACDPIGEGIRMCICPEPVKQETFSEEVSVRIEDWSGTEVMRVDQKPMTATQAISQHYQNRLKMQPGTAEAMKEMARKLAEYAYPMRVVDPGQERPVENGPGIAKPPHTFYRYEELRDAAMRCLEGGDGIAAKIPVRQRSLRSQTLTWAPYADWDNLPDAD